MVGDLAFANTWQLLKREENKAQVLAMPGGKVGGREPTVENLSSAPQDGQPQLDGEKHDQGAD